MKQQCYTCNALAIPCLVLIEHKATMCRNCTNLAVALLLLIRNPDLADRFIKEYKK